jgi:mannose-1-phosphate guanylyltransferase/phosphomannomutase
MSSINQNKPKILMQIGNKKLIDIQLEQIAKSGFKRVTYLLGIGASYIIQALEEKKLSSDHDLEIDWIVESESFGTGGSIIHALEKLESQFMVMYGDLLVYAKFDELARQFQESRALFACVAHPTNHMSDSNVLEVDERNKIKTIRLKGLESKTPIRNLANTGLYFFTKIVFENFQTKKLDLDQDVIPALLNQGVEGVALRHKGFVKDVGTPSRLKDVEKKIALFEHLTGPRPALFLDRDGVINRQVGHITHRDQLCIFPAIAALIRRFNDAGYLVLVVTNQPVISHGALTLEELDHIHACIDEELAKNGAFIDNYFVCPHHPDTGFPGEIRNLKIACECRKPKTGLIQQSSLVHNLDFKHSIMLGDTWRDKECAASLGITYYSVDRVSEGDQEIDRQIAQISPHENWWRVNANQNLGDGN